MRMVFSDCKEELSINSLDGLIKGLEDIRQKYGDFKLGDDNHWVMSIDTIPSGCLVGTEDDGSDALDIEVFFKK